MPYCFTCLARTTDVSLCDSGRPTSGTAAMTTDDEEGTCLARMTDVSLICDSGRLLTSGRGAMTDEAG